MWVISQQLDRFGVEAFIDSGDIGVTLSVKCLNSGELLQEVLSGYRLLCVEQRLRVLPPACTKTGAVAMHDCAIYELVKLAGKLRQGQAIEQARAVA